MKRILFLCTGTSCRSQMAEGWARALLGSQFEVYSAGIVAKGIDPRAVQVMAEHGIDISGQRSKTLVDLPPVAFDVVFTLCGDAAETCPIFSGAKVVHHGFDDPPRMALLAADDEEALNCYRTVCIEIADFVPTLPESC